MWPIARRSVFALVPSTTIAEKPRRAISIRPINPPAAAKRRRRVHPRARLNGALAILSLI
jgi:hypothetical protein